MGQFNYYEVLSFHSPLGQQATVTLRVSLSAVMEQWTETLANVYEWIVPPSCAIPFVFVPPYSSIHALPCVLRRPSRYARLHLGY